MILKVAVIDFCWAILLLAMYLKSPTAKMRKLTIAVFFYSLIELALHKPMEAIASDIMLNLSSIVPSWLL